MAELTNKSKTKLVVYDCVYVHVQCMCVQCACVQFACILPVTVHVVLAFPSLPDLLCVLQEATVKDAPIWNEILHASDGLPGGTLWCGLRLW